MAMQNNIKFKNTMNRLIKSLINKQIHIKFLVFLLIILSMIKKNSIMLRRMNKNLINKHWKTYKNSVKTYQLLILNKINKQIKKFNFYKNKIINYLNV